MDYKDLIEKAKGGDEAAFGVVYSELYTPIFKYIYTRVRVRETAEDITADVFMKFYGALDSYEVQGDTPLLYLYTIARNLIINNGKKKKAELFEDGAEFNVADPSKNQMEKSLIEGDMKLVMRALETLEENQQEVIRLKFLSELTTKEVADILQKTESNVRQLESRGLRKLREMLHNN